MKYELIRNGIRLEVERGLPFPNHKLEDVNGA